MLSLLKNINFLFYEYKYKNIIVNGKIISYLYYLNNNFISKYVVLIVLYDNFIPSKKENFFLNKMINIIQINNICICYVCILDKKYKIYIDFFVNYELKKKNFSHILLLDKGNEKKILLDNFFFKIRTYSPRDSI